MHIYAYHAFSMQQNFAWNGFFDVSIDATVTNLFYHVVDYQYDVR
jgi:hypothetical protein